jgi:nucleoside-diphosphate-sugar epimerase
MTTLVTCGTGFVSQAFLRALHARRAPARTIVRDPSYWRADFGCDVIRGDIFDTGLLQRAVQDVRAVIHVSPRVYPTGSQAEQLAAHRQAHVESTRLLLDACVRNGVEKFAYVSSALATGQRTDRVLCELTAEPPSSAYARAKLEAEKLVLSFCDGYGLDAVILRPPSIYGPGDRSLFVTALRRAAASSWPMPFGNIDTPQSLIYVDDLARAGLALLDKGARRGPHRVFIIKDPEDYKPAQVYTAVGRALGKQVSNFGVPGFAITLAAKAGRVLHAVPGVRGFASFGMLLTPRRYCGHLFSEAVPEFQFAGLGRAVSETMTHASAGPALSGRGN